MFVALHESPSSQTFVVRNAAKKRMGNYIQNNVCIDDHITESMELIC